MPQPHINVTPLIDVLLVLLIIFMVVSPLKPSNFKTKVPAQPTAQAMPVDTDPNALVVSIDTDLSLSLNSTKDLGTVNVSQKLTDELRFVFEQRDANGSVDAFGNTPKAVFVRAPRTLGYGSVAKAVDAVKLAGAEPIALQIDYLD